MSALIRGTPVIASRSDVSAVLRAVRSAGLTKTNPEIRDAVRRLGLVCDVWDPTAKVPGPVLAKRIEAESAR